MATINQYYPESVTHPGSILLEALEENKLKPKVFAIKAGKPEKTISAVLNGNSSITSEMAISFEQILNIPAHFWMEAQNNFDEFQARLSYQAIIADAVEWAREFPYAVMARFNWLPKTSKAEEKVIHLFKYFGVANLKGWNDYYLNQKTKVAFRISLKGIKNHTAIASWLRQGEIQAQTLETPEFDIKKLKQLLPEIKSLMASQPQDFFKVLQKTCLKAGVKVVHTPCLPNAAIHGSTRWINDVPLIQLSGRWRRNDVFWFTFFHEIGHILLHGKKYISMENIDYDGEVKEFEDEADAFASDWILTQKQQNEIVKKQVVTTKEIIDFAVKFNTHPAAIIGRLQFLGLLPFGLGNEFFKSIDFND